MIPGTVTTLPHPSLGIPCRARSRRKLGFLLQVLGWMCGVLVVLGAPFMPLIALLLLPLLSFAGWNETGAEVIVVAVALLFLLLPVSLCLVHIGGEMRASPVLDNTCIRCGYDLRGSGHSQRCPECGTTI